MMDVVAGVSGSSPAYVYMFIEALADGAAFRYNKRDLQNPWFVCRAHNCAIG